MKTMQIRAGEGRSDRPDASEPRPAGANQTTAVINDVLRQIIREELAALQFRSAMR